MRERPEKTDENELAHLMGRNSQRITEVQDLVTHLENVLFAMKLWPDRFPVSALAEALHDCCDESERLTAAGAANSQGSRKPSGP